MNRLLVLLLAAFDAVLAVAVGVAIALAPLTLLWVFAFGADADWLALWPAAVRVWQLGNLVPLGVSLPEEYTSAAAIPAEGAQFALSLAPAAFAVFAAVSGARSGRRGARSGAWAVGVMAGAATTAVLAAALQVTSHTAVVEAATLPAIVLPTLVFAVPALIAALVTAWGVGDDGVVDRVRAAVPPRFALVPVAAMRGAGAALAGTVGVGGLLVVVALVLRGGEVIALYEAAGVDLAGVVVIALGQLAYLPVLVVWAASFAAGPGFALGTATSVTPAGTSTGVVPGIPVLGAIPPSVSPWLLTLALLIVGAGALAGLVVRRVLDQRPFGPSALDRRGLARGADAGGLAPRLAALGALLALTGSAALVLGAAAAGSIGPGTLAEAGPVPWTFALAVALETGVGAAIVLLAPRRAEPVPSRASGKVAEFWASRRNPPRSPASSELDDAGDGGSSDDVGTDTGPDTDPDFQPTEEILRPPGD